MNDYELDHIVKQCEYLDRLLKWNPLISIEMSTPKVEVSFMRKIWDKLWSLDSYKTTDVDKEEDKMDNDLRECVGERGNRVTYLENLFLEGRSPFKGEKRMTLDEMGWEFIARRDAKDKVKKESKQKECTSLSYLEKKLKELKDYKITEGHDDVVFNSVGYTLSTLDWQARLHAYGVMIRDEKDYQISTEKGEKEETPKSADRYNKGKAPISMVLEAGAAITGAAKVLDFGAKKYSRNNYRKGLSHTEIIDSLLRHAIDYLSGIDIDPDSKLPVVDHITSNALFLAEMFHTGLGTDDRTVGVKDGEG